MHNTLKNTSSTMEFSLSSVLFTLSLVLFLVNLLSSITASRKRTKHVKLPPGPPKLPIIGNLHHLSGLQTHRALLNISKAYGPLVHLQLGEVSAVVVTSPDVAKEVMHTHDVCFASRPEIIAANIMLYGGTDLVFSPYGDYWRKLRKFYMMELLSAKRVRSFCSIREDEVAKLVRTIASKGPDSPVNFSFTFHELTSDMTARAAFGSICKEKHTYMSAIKDAIGFGFGFTAADLFPSYPFVRLLSGIDRKLGKCHKKTDTVLNSIIAEHREWRKNNSMGDAVPEQDNLLDVLLTHQETGYFGFPLTDTAIKAIIFDAFQGGTGTSGSLLTWAMAELMKNPRVMKKAQSELREALKGKTNLEERDISDLTYIKLVVKEALRLHPPAPMIVPRVCRETCEVHGYEIQEGTRVIINAWALGRDPRYWDDAEEFKPERFEGSSVDFKGNNFEFIPFGSGRRICPGITFGLVGMELALAGLLYYFDWTLPNGMTCDDLDMTETSGIGARKKIDLIVHGTPWGPLPVN